MRHVLISLALAAGVLAFTCGSALASPDTGGTVVKTPLSFAIDPFQEELQIDALSSSTDPGTQHIGPIHSTSPDSGTCGNDWAQDEFDRFYTIHSTGPGTYTVQEQFKNGSFVTMAGPSPGACDSSDGYGPGLVGEGLTGTMHGYLIDRVACLTPAPCDNPNGSCEFGACDTTSGFLAEFFPNALVTTDAYFFHYAGYDGTNEALIVHEWKNASCNRGGNHGDIASVSTSGPEIAVCT